MRARCTWYLMGINVTIARIKTKNVMLFSCNGYEIHAQVD